MGRLGDNHTLPRYNFGISQLLFSYYGFRSRTCGISSESFNMFLVHFYIKAYQTRGSHVVSRIYDAYAVLRWQSLDASDS
jgi:hypothetical protein